MEGNVPSFACDEVTPSTSACADFEDEDLDEIRYKQEFVELSSRQNIYDDDEFDVFKKDRVDTSKILFGKK